MLFQEGRSMGRTLITVKEDIIFRPTSYNHTVRHSCKLCTKAELYCNIEKESFGQAGASGF